jgi:hypothetical protein
MKRSRTVEHLGHKMANEEISQLKPAKKVRKFLGIRIAAIIQIVVMMALLLAVDYFWEEDNRYMTVEPHPFWAIVLLITVQYGTVEGILAAFICSLALYAGNIPTRAVNESLLQYQLQFAKLPFLWFMTAFILGEIRLRVERQKTRLEDSLEELTEQASIVCNAYQKLRVTKEHQDHLLASQRKTVASIYKTFRFLKAESPSQLLLDLDKIFSLALNPKKFSVFAMGANGFEVASSHGWTEGDIFQRRISTGTPLFQAVGVQRRLVTAVDPKDEEILQGQGVLAGPLLDPEKNELLGMVKVEDVDYLELNVNTLEAFQALCEIVGVAYAHARRVRTLERNALYSETPGLFSWSFFKEQRQYLQSLMHSLKQPLMFIMLEAAEPGSFKQEIALVNLLTPLVQPLGQIFKVGRHHMQIGILLPETSKERATELAFKIIESAEKDQELGVLKLSQRVEVIVEPQLVSMGRPS